MANKQKKATRELDHGFEIDQYINALGESSSRVRFVMLAIIIAAVASIATFWSEHDGAWERARLETLDKNYALAKACKIWEYPTSYKTSCKRLMKGDFRLEGDGTPPLAPQYLYLYAPPNCNDKKICNTIKWLNRIGISTEDGAKTFAEKQWEAYINNVLYVRTPVLGLTFDINDLGLITGLTFSILMLVMVFYSNRAHENLALSMWKVREIAERDGGFDKPGSKANLLYHALAVQQVFTVPPTLARWHDIKIFRKSHYILFTLPFIVQSLVMSNDIASVANGFSVNRIGTLGSLISQAVFLIFIFFLCAICCAHLHADDRLWERVFLHINPGHSLKAKAMWRHWVKLTDNRPPAWGIAVKETTTDKVVLFIDSVSSRLWEFKVDNNISQKGLPRSARKLSSLMNTRARGLYLHATTKEAMVYSEPSDVHRLRDVPKRKEYLKERPGPTARAKDSREILPGLVQGYEFRFSPKGITKSSSSSPNNIIWSVGGGNKQMDGPRRVAGFSFIHSLAPDNDAIFVTDDAWIRKIDAYGKVSTWGGQPLGLVLRPERAFLLGISLVNFSITPQEKNIRTPLPHPKLLVCDYSLRRVFAVDEDGMEEVYKSPGSWAPTGIYMSGATILVLEYKQARMVGELINYILRARPERSKVKRIFKTVFFFRSYARIRKFEGGSFKGNSEVICKLSLFRIWRNRAAAK